MRFDKKSKQQQYRVNEEIREREVRIVGEGIESIVLPTRDAIRMAEEKGVDLIEISPNATPPVCRLIEYSRFIYQQKKKAKEMKAKQVKMELKEIRFGPQTAEADYNFKLKHAIGFLKEGNKVKAYVFFKGRSIVFKEQGEVLLLRFANDLEELAKVENMPVLEGKRMSIILSPRKPGQPKKSQQKQDAEREKQKKVQEQQNADVAVQTSEPSSVEKSEESSE